MLPQLRDRFHRGDERRGGPGLGAPQPLERALAGDLGHQPLGGSGRERQPAATHPRRHLDEHAAAAEQHDRAEVGPRLQPDEGFAVTTDERLHDDRLRQIVGARDRAQLADGGGKVVGLHVDPDRADLGAVRCVGELDDEPIAESP